MNSADTMKPPLPLPGMEYWGLEARVRFAALTEHCADKQAQTGYRVVIEALIDSWSFPLRGELFWNVYDLTGLSEAERARRGTKLHLFISDSDICDITHYTHKIVYLRVIELQGADDRVAALPGAAARPLMGLHAAAQLRRAAPPSAADGASDGDLLSSLTVGAVTANLTALTTDDAAPVQTSESADRAVTGAAFGSDLSSGLDGADVTSSASDFGG